MASSIPCWLRDCLPPPPSRAIRTVAAARRCARRRLHPTRYLPLARPRDRAPERASRSVSLGVQGGRRGRRRRRKIGGTTYWRGAHGRVGRCIWALEARGSRRITFDSLQALWHRNCRSGRSTTDGVYNLWSGYRVRVRFGYCNLLLCA